MEVGGIHDSPDPRMAERIRSWSRPEMSPPRSVASWALLGVVVGFVVVVDSLGGDLTGVDLDGMSILDCDATTSSSSSMSKSGNSSSVEEGGLGDASFRRLRLACSSAGLGTCRDDREEVTATGAKASVWRE